MPEPYWHHNVHYQRLVLRAVPDGCAHALDVGCGDGLLAHKLTARLPAVTGVGRSPEAIRTAREQSRHLPNVTFRRAGYLGDHLPAHAHSLVSAVVHHTDHRQAFGVQARLPAGGGRLVVIGLGRDRSALDWGVRLAGRAVSRVMALRRGGKSGAGMPAMGPVAPWAEIAQVARQVLPGYRFRRLLLRRYALI